MYQCGDALNLLQVDVGCITATKRGRKAWNRQYGIGVSNTTSSGTALSATSDENATGYWVVLSGNGATAPSAAQVKLGKDSAGNAGVTSGPLWVGNAQTGFQTNGLMQVAVNEVVMELAPTLVDAQSFLDQFNSMDATASALVMYSGVIKVTANGAQYALLPAWTAKPSSLAGLSSDASGYLAYGDTRMQQTLKRRYALGWGMGK